ncbi:MAG: diguanylate cyclase, partial [Firmicutes bacterium]|nr:diguanylate cyclase [Bacillota bacterium]
VSGILLMPDGPVLICAHAITNSEATAPARGTLTFVRRLDRTLIDALAAVTGSDLDLLVLDGSSLPLDYQAARDALLVDGTKLLVRPLDPNTVAGYSVIEDLYGEPTLILRLGLPRDILRQGQMTVDLLAGVLFAAGLFVMAGAGAAIDAAVVSRISRMSQAVNRIAGSSDLGNRVEVFGDDEVSTLGRCINGLLQSVEGGVQEIERMAMSLRQSEELHRAIIETQGEGVAALDQDLRFTLANPALHQIFGVPPGELVGRSLSEFTDEETFTAIRARTCEASHVQPGVYEIRVERPNRETCTVIVSDRPRYDARGEFSGLFSVFRDVTDQRRAEEKIRFLSFHDALTGLHNRAYLEEKLKRFDNQDCLPLSLIMGDLNGLKLVNDTLGHDCGDRLLANMARVLRDACRREDIIARWGGDEFVIVLPSTTERAALEICDRIREGCAKADPDPIQLSIALGAATKNTASVSVSILLREAEERMYRNKLIEGADARNSLILSLRKSLAERTHETEEHTTRLQELATELGRAIGLSPSQLDEIVLACALHDIGKVRIPGHILTKKGSLTPDEWEVIKKHSETGYRIAQSSFELSHIAEIILSHHERWDGSGYPRGLMGDEIPLAARIIAIVDTYDVITQGRPYKPPVSPQAALAELERCAGTQFDPSLVNLFIRIVRGSTRFLLAGEAACSQPPRTFTGLAHPK